jgi:hypothetical protein
LAAAVVIACWLFPRHKPFEQTVAIVGIYVATLLVESPSARRVFWSGSFVGAAAFVGRNHGVYLAVAFLALLAWLRLPHGGRALARDALTWAAGVVIGYLPMLALLAFVPGFSHAFTESFGSFLRLPPLPLLWTWGGLTSGAPFIDNMKLVALGCLHILAPAMFAYMVVGLIQDARSGVTTPPVIVGATFVGGVYLHYMFSHPDIRHFAQGVVPLMVGWGALAVARHAGTRGRLVATVAGCFVLLTCASVVLERPVVRYWLGMDRYRTVAVKGRTLIVPPAVERMVSVTAELAPRFPPDGGVLIVPNWPMLYVLLDRPAPIYDTYTLVPEGDEGQRQIIRDLGARDVRWIIVNDLSGNRRRAPNSFQTTHPLVWDHIRAKYAPELLTGAPKNYLLFHASPGT